MSKVSITECHTYNAHDVRKALIQGLTPFGGLDFIRPGMRIGIKMNLVTLKNYHAAATTHPIVLAELARLIIERGAEAVIGDSPGRFPHHICGRSISRQAFPLQRKPVRILILTRGLRKQHFHPVKF